MQHRKEVSGNDRSIFARTADKTKAINIHTKISRGGTRL